MSFSRSNRYSYRTASSPPDDSLALEKKLVDDLGEQFLQVGMPARSADRSGLRKAVDEDFLKRLEFAQESGGLVRIPVGRSREQPPTVVVQGSETVEPLHDPRRIPSTVVAKADRIDAERPHGL